ncbi:flagellar protein FlaG [Solibacillus sp. FSL W7-1472]|uniref:flagellar protein FlaG n=1 Tax=Solibacillus sp. FSL W7-1472 TaxID=2921707 RepID=UPI0030DBDD78
MRISGTTSIESTATIRVATNNNTAKDDEKKQSDSIAKKETTIIESMFHSKNDDETKSKVKEAVDTMNEMLDVNNSTSKFIFHEGLERYYVTVVNRDTEEVVKEIPPKKLLDAFYEMQKMLGMIVDEKI